MVSWMFSSWASCWLSSSNEGSSGVRVVFCGCSVGVDVGKLVSCMLIIWPVSVGVSGVVMSGV